ncbi:MAG TPA: TatD family hydrolase [Acidimicrobiales bacterium]|nr:TatD family hydrolase [Acidimicrobiales bacterium]
MWTDSHCHIPPGEEGTATIAEAAAAGVTRLVNVGTDAQTSRTAIEVAGAHDGVWATVGVHPHDAKDGLDGITGLLEAPEVVAVGECGLDYHYDHSPRPVQRQVFAAQVGLAHDHGLALVIHTREAWDDTFAVLASEGTPLRTVFHCFTGGPAEAERALSTGAVLSFSGIVTFKGASELRHAASVCPLDRLTVETDSPYLAPMPHRGAANRPAWVPLVGAAVAAAKGVDPARVEDASSATAARLFALPPP